jgi:hypothetical protein
MTIKDTQLKKILVNAAEYFATRWSYDRVRRLQNDVSDHMYSDSKPDKENFWQCHLKFLELNADEKGDYAMLVVDISDNRQGGVCKKGSAWNPITASLILYSNGTHEISI